MHLVILTLPVFLLSLQRPRVISSEYMSHVPVCRCETESLKVNIFNNFLSFPLRTPAPFPSTALCAASQRWGPHTPETCGCTVAALFAQIKVCYEWTFAPSEHDDVQFDRITPQLVRVTLRVFYVCLPRFTGIVKVGLWFGEGRQADLNVFWPSCSSVLFL